MSIFWIIALLVALSIHEYAHARVADELGDPTPRLNGRLTLNPLSHLDPLGTLALFFFHVGWGKPVPIDPYNLRNPRRDQALIALAGPTSNLILAVLTALILRLLVPILPTPISSLLLTLLTATVIMNLGLGIFNLIPLHPLDGAKIVLGFLPLNLAQEWEETIGQYSLILLLLLFLPLFRGQSLLSLFLFPLISFFTRLLLPGVGFI